MSEELTTSSTKRQNSTQGGCTPSPNFNFSVTLHVHMTAAPALQKALEKIADALKPTIEPETKIVFRGLNEEQAGELVEKGVIDQVMTGLESADDFEFKGVFVPPPNWIKINGYKGLRYYEDGGKLFLKYQGSSVVETSWEQMVKLSLMSFDDCKNARDKLLEDLNIAGNKTAATAISCFVVALQKKKVVPPESVMAGFEKTPARPEKKHAPKIYWTGIPKHPHLKYREDAGKLILNYAGSIVTTDWDTVEKTARLDQKYWKHEIESIAGERATSTRKAAISLFIKLVEKGEISRVTISQFQSDEDMGVSA